MSTPSFEQKYKVLSKVGEGSFSEVLKCQDRETGVLYAAKRLKKIKKNMEEVLSSNELITLLKLQSHPHILNMVERHVDPLPGKLTLIFELMDMSLYDLIRSRKRSMPESKVKDYIYQTLKGLSHMHSNGLFHRDIKPENILLKNDTVKIADLGSVKGMYMRKPYTEYISTRWYRSPECLLTKGYYGPKMDIWAIGCVFYELVTLRPLFPGSSEVDMIHKIHNIIGTPNSRTITKFKQTQHRNCQYFFPGRSGSGINYLLPNASEGGREVLKQSLIYDPDLRSSVRRLLEHRYFNNLRELDETPRKRITLESSSPLARVKPKQEWRNPVLLSYLASNKKKKTKLTTIPESVKPRENQDTKSSDRSPVIMPKVPSHIVKIKSVKQKLLAKRSEEPSTNSTKVSPRKMLVVQKEDVIKHAALRQKKMEKPLGELTLKLNPVKKGLQKVDTSMPLLVRQQQALKNFVTRNTMKISPQKAATIIESNAFVSTRRSMTPLPPIKGSVQKQPGVKKWPNKPSVVKSPRKQLINCNVQLRNPVAPSLHKPQVQDIVDEKQSIDKNKVKLPPINKPRTELNAHNLVTKDADQLLGGKKSIFSTQPKPTIIPLAPRKVTITSNSSAYLSSLPQLPKLDKPALSHLRPLPHNKLHQHPVHEPTLRITNLPKITINR